MIIEYALKAFYNKDLATMIRSIQNNITDSFIDVYSNENCSGTVCPDQYASESISLACRFAYRNATAGSTLQDMIIYDPGCQLSRLDWPKVQSVWQLFSTGFFHNVNQLPVNDLNRWVQERMKMSNLRGIYVCLFTVLCIYIVFESSVEAWSMEGHAMTCKIAQGMLEPEVAHAVQMLLPDYVNGDLSAICAWPDQVRHWYKYRWTSPLHFIDTPDQACTFKYQRDCHDPHGAKDMCVAGAITNFTNQLSHYRHGTADRRYNMTEALLFLAHFMGDIHQPMHVGFTSDEGGNTIGLRWFGHKSNLHHVWDREIILTAAANFYDKDINLLQEDIEGNITDGIWSGDLVSWRDCPEIFSCVNKYAVESIDIACKWGYKNVKSGDTLSDDYFNSRLPIVMKRVAQGGVRLAMILNRVFGDSHESSIVAT
ncbi:Endonuclease 1 [Orobanche gracilis]